MTTEKSSIMYIQKNHKKLGLSEKEARTCLYEIKKLKKSP